jgi:hypothetical protein
MSNGRTGASLGGIESSPQRRARQAAKRKREEKRWAKRSGPVTVRFVDPATLKPSGVQARPAGENASWAGPTESL